MDWYLDEGTVHRCERVNPFTSLAGTVISRKFHGYFVCQMNVYVKKYPLIQFDFLEMLLVNDADDCDGPHDEVLQQSRSYRKSEKQGKADGSVDPAKMSGVI